MGAQNFCDGLTLVLLMEITLRFVQPIQAMTQFEDN